MMINVPFSRGKYVLSCTDSDPYECMHKIYHMVLRRITVETLRFFVHFTGLT